MQADPRNGSAAGATGEPVHPPLAIIGGGNMARAIYLGARDAGVLDESRVVVADPSPEKQALYPGAVDSANAALDRLESMEGGAGEGQVLLAVKPQIFPLVAEEIGERLGAGPARVVISLLAGTQSATIREALGGTARVVRIMPNTPAQVRRGMSAIAVGDGAEAGDGSLAVTLMEAVGETIRIDEDMMDAFTGLAGSGPAYVFYLAEAMARAGEAVGFAPDDARRIAEAVVIGSARLLEADGRPASELRRAVTSPKGTTQAGTETLDRLGVMGAFTEAITAARDRGRELAGG
jgi:pyrroline-5-carboxylate reductase